eukprot:RCo021965
MSRSSQEPPLRPSNRMRSRSERARCDACKEREVQNAQLHSEMRALEMELKELRKRPDRGYCGRCREWEAQYAQLQSENHSLGTQLQELQKRIQELNEIIRGHEADAKLLTAQKQQLKVENERLKTQTAELLRELEQAKSVSGTDSRGSPWVGSELPSGVRSITPYAQDLARERDELAATNKRLVENLADLQRQLQERSGSERRPRPPSLSDTPNSFSDSSSQPPALAEPQEASDQGSNAPLKQKIRHLEVQLEKSTNVIAVKDDELAQLRELLGALSNVGMIPEGRHAGRDSSSTEGSGARSFDPRGVKPSFGGKPSTKTELVPQLQRVLGSLGSENVRLLQENSQLSTMVHELNSQVASLQAFRDEANQTHQRLQAQVGDTTLMKSLQTELSAAHMFISELEAELGAAREEASKLQSDSTQRENFVGSLQARLAQAEQELRDTVQKLDQTSRAAAEEAQKRDIFFAELKSQLVSHISSFAGELKEVLGQLGGLLPVLSESLEKHALSGARASIDQALHVAQGFLRVIQGFSMEKLSGAQEDAVVQGVLQQVAFAEQRCTQQAAENRCLVDELKAAERKAAEKTEQIFRLQSDKMLMDSLLLQSNQDLLQLRASLGRLEIANAQLEAALAMLFGQNGFFKLKYQQLLRAKHEAMQDETYHLQQEVSRMSGALRQAHLQAQEHDLMFEKLKQERDIIAEEEAKLRAELGAVRGTAVSDNARLKAELSSCAMQLEQVSKAQREKSEEIMRLQQVISNLTVSSREAQYEAQDREAELEALKHEREQWLEENAKLRADSGKIRSELSSISLAENTGLKDELRSCAMQLDQAIRRQQEEHQEVLRLQQEVSSLSFSARDRELAIEQLAQARNQSLDECAKARAQLAAVRGTDSDDNSRLREELRGCSCELERSRRALQGKCDEVAQLQQEIRSLTGSLRQVQQDREQCLRESAGLQSQLAEVCSSANAESCRLQNELKTASGQHNEVLRLQQQLLSASTSAQEREQALRAALQDREQTVKERDQLRAELTTIRGAAITDTARLKDELKVCAGQLEQSAKALHQKNEEVLRLQQEVSKLSVAVRQAQIQSQDQSVFDKLKVTHQQGVEECSRLRAELEAVSGAAHTESARLKEEIKICAVRLEQATASLQEKNEELHQLQQQLLAMSGSAQERDVLLAELAMIRGAALTETARLKDELKACAVQLEQSAKALHQKNEEVLRLQQEVSKLSVTVRQAQLQLRDRDITLEKLVQERDQCLEDSARLRVNSSKGMRAYAAPSEQASRDQQSCAEVFRLQQEVSSLKLVIQQLQLEAQERLVTVQHEQKHEECSLLRAELASVREAALVENGCLRDELKVCTLQLQQATEKLMELQMTRLPCESSVNQGEYVCELQSEIRSLSEQLRHTREELAAQIAVNAKLSVEVQTTACGLAGESPPSVSIMISDNPCSSDVQTPCTRDVECLRGQLDASLSDLSLAQRQLGLLQEENARLAAAVAQLRSKVEELEGFRSSGIGRVLEFVRTAKHGTR